MGCGPGQRSPIRSIRAEAARSAWAEKWGRLCTRRLGLRHQGRSTLQSHGRPGTLAGACSRRGVCSVHTAVTCRALYSLGGPGTELGRDPLGGLRKRTGSRPQHTVAPLHPTCCTAGSARLAEFCGEVRPGPFGIRRKGAGLELSRSPGGAGSPGPVLRVLSGLTLGLVLLGLMAQWCGGANSCVLGLCLGDGEGGTGAGRGRQGQGEGFLTRSQLGQCLALPLHCREADPRSSASSGCTTLGKGERARSTHSCSCGHHPNRRMSHPCQTP